VSERGKRGMAHLDDSFAQRPKFWHHQLVESSDHLLTVASLPQPKQTVTQRRALAYTNAF